MLFQMQSFSSRNDQIKETASGTAYVYLCIMYAYVYLCIMYAYVYCIN